VPRLPDSLWSACSPRPSGRLVSTNSESVLIAGIARTQTGRRFTLSQGKLRSATRSRKSSGPKGLEPIVYVAGAEECGGRDCVTN